MFGSNWPSSIRSSSGSAYPPVNISATPERVDVHVYGAGLDAAALDISVQQNVLTLQGVRETGTVTDDAHFRRERYRGAFRRVISLPEDVDPDRVSATYREGVLHIQCMRRGSSKPRRIEIA
jgi:HSP20 family protein